MSFEFQSHHPILQEGNLVGYKVTPYISVAIGGDTKAVVVTVQGGRFWGSGGQEIALDEVPDEILAAIDGWSDTARQSVGLAAKGPRPAAKKVG